MAMTSSTADGEGAEPPGFATSLRICSRDVPTSERPQMAPRVKASIQACEGTLSQLLLHFTAILAKLAAGSDW